ncbi:MAG: hypothetical protein NZZ41_07035 [Candidatus Dojkabacteria bacterium]|nr:hypothetical protein [Candidatus Dojkabacteria bacterium]
MTGLLFILFFIAILSFISGVIITLYILIKLEMVNTSNFFKDLFNIKKLLHIDEKNQNTKPFNNKSSKTTNNEIIIDAEYKEIR